MQCVLHKISFVFVFHVLFTQGFPTADAKLHYFSCSWLMSVFVPISYILTVPVDSALVSHSRSLSLNGRRTRLTPCFTSTALSGYRKWCVVLFPTSFSNPLVMALFILRRRRKGGEGWRRQRWGRVWQGVMSAGDAHTGLRSRGSLSACRYWTVAVCRSCQPLRKYGIGKAGAWSLLWARKWLGTSLIALPLESGRYQTAEVPAERWSTVRCLNNILKTFFLIIHLFTINAKL